MSFSIGRIIGCTRKTVLWSPVVLPLEAKSCLVSGVSVQIKPLRPFVRFKMVIFAFQNITNCNVEIILSFDFGLFWE